MLASLLGVNVLPELYRFFSIRGGRNEDRFRASSRNLLLSSPPANPARDGIRIDMTRGGECSMRNLELGVEELEPMEAPGLWSWVAGIGVGVIVGGAILYAGIAIT